MNETADSNPSDISPLKRCVEVMQSSLSNRSADSSFDWQQTASLCLQSVHFSHSYQCFASVKSWGSELEVMSGLAAWEKVARSISKGGGGTRGL